MAVLEPGTELKRGTFVIVSELGRGGFGAVYLAKQPRMRREVAIKVLLERVAENPEVVARFQREALAAASLSHPHVLPVFDFDFDDQAGVWFLAMQYVPGGRTLKDRLAQPSDLPESLRILDAVASALDTAHAQGVVHRDVKPANVLLDRDRPILTDFGIAHLSTMTELTASGVAMGTPTYMPPEQALGKEVGPFSDQYSLAVMAYETLAGRPPFVGDRMSVMFAHVNTEPPPLRELNPALPDGIDAVLARGMRKDPQERYPSCGELAAALRKAAGVLATMPSGRASALMGSAATDVYIPEGPPLPSRPATPATEAGPAGWSRVQAVRAQQASAAPARQLPMRLPALLAAAGVLLLLLVAGAIVGPGRSLWSANTGEQVAVGGASEVEASAASIPTSPPQQPSSGLTITSNPDGAAILVDGEPAGRTPRLVRLSHGEHDLTLLLPSYHDWTRRIQLLDGQQLSVPADLVPLPASQVLEVTEQRLGSDAYLDASSIIRLSAFTDTFQLSDDVNAIVYLRPRTHGIRDLSFATLHRWERAGTQPIELSGLQQVPKDWEQTFVRACAPALALDARGSGVPLGLEIYVDGDLLASFSFTISGGNPANAPASPCEASSAPRTSV